MPSPPATSGRPLLDAVRSTAEVLVAEVSSFQLVFTTEAFRPRVAVLLNVADDHLDWHGTFDDYSPPRPGVRAPAGDDVLVFNADDEEVARLAADAPARRLPFAGGTRSAANAAAAGAAAREVGATDVGIEAALRDFTGAPAPRGAGWGAGGVRYYDDSKATNPHATLAAVGEAPGPVVLIAGRPQQGPRPVGAARARPEAAGGRGHRRGRRRDRGRVRGRSAGRARR